MEEQERQEESSGRKRPRAEDASSSSCSIVWADDNLSATVTFSNVNNHDDDNEKRPHILCCIQGRALVRCLSSDGSEESKVTVMGYQLKAGDCSVAVDSPSWNSLLTIETTTTTTTAVQVQISSLRPRNNCITSFQLLSPQEARSITRIPTSWSSALDTILQDWTTTASSHQASSMDDSDRFAEEVNSQVTTTTPNSILICGTRRVGKSTCLRYDTNRLLSSSSFSCHQVAILDADVGQPELAPPGMLSLKLVSQPLLAPPYEQVRQQQVISSGGEGESEQSRSTTTTIAQVFFGSVTTRSDPMRFLSNVQQLLEAYRHYIRSNNENNIPVLVNMDGWVQGMGFQLLTSILQEVRPSHILQLVGSSSKSFDLSSSVHKEDTTSRLLMLESAITTHLTEAQQDQVDPEHRVLAASIKPGTLREVRLGAYFCANLEGLWDDDFQLHQQEGWIAGHEDGVVVGQHLAADHPYCVPMEAVRLEILGEDHGDIQSEERAWDAVNASIVGLHSSRDNNCLGLGLVRSIDRIRRLFYILTPVPADQLQDVDTLLLGNLETPKQFYFRGIEAESFPYLVFDKRNNNKDSSKGGAAPILGSDPMHSRNSVGRKSLMNGNN